MNTITMSSKKMSGMYGRCEVIINRESGVNDREIYIQRKRGKERLWTTVEPAGDKEEELAWIKR